jgi:hypothetical protein
MKKVNLKVAVLSVATLAATACGGKETFKSSATPTNSAPVRLSATLEGGVTTAPGFKTAGQKIQYGSDVTITSVKVVLGNVTLYSREDTAASMHEISDNQGGNDNRNKNFGANDTTDASDDVTGETGMASNKIQFVGPFLLDLTTSTFSPSLTDVTVPTGRYKKMDLIFQKLSAADATAMSLPASDAVIGHSFVIEGWLKNVTIAGAVTDETVKFRIVGDQDESFKVNLKKGIVIEEGSLNDILLSFNAAGWFPSNLVGQLKSELTAQNLQTDPVTGERVLVIPASQGTASQFKKLFRKSIQVAKDKNRDHHIDADEGGESLE